VESEGDLTGPYPATTLVEPHCAFEGRDDVENRPKTTTGGLTWRCTQERLSDPLTPGVRGDEESSHDTESVNRQE